MICLICGGRCFWDGDAYMGARARDASDSILNRDYYAVAASELEGWVHVDGPQDHPAYVWPLPQLVGGPR